MKIIIEENMNKSTSFTNSMKDPNSTRIILNVSGEIYETLPKTLKRYPKTILGNLSDRHSHYCPISRQYFFHRNRMCFGAILFFYQSQGILRCPPGIPIEVFEEECIFFQLPEHMIISMKDREGFLPLTAEDPIKIQYTITLKSKLWNMIDNPNSSVIAWCYGFVVLLTTTLSIWTICLSTTSFIRKNMRSVEHVQIIDLVINICMLVDVLLRLGLTPDRGEFIKCVTTWLDIVSCLAYFFSLLLQRNCESSLLHFLSFVRILRAFRLFRLAKHFRRLRIAGEILISICKDLKLFLVCILLITIFYGSLMHFIERDKGFTSMLHACWWAVQTITTVGYGDVVPVTLLGKLFAGCFMAFGTQLILLPVLTIVNKFTSMYTQNEWINEWICCINSIGITECRRDVCKYVLFGVDSKLLYLFFLKINILFLFFVLLLSNIILIILIWRKGLFTNYVILSCLYAKVYWLISLIKRSAKYMHADWLLWRDICIIFQ